MCHICQVCVDVSDIQGFEQHKNPSEVLYLFFLSCNNIKISKPKKKKIIDYCWLLETKDNVLNILKISRMWAELVIFL